MGAVRTAATLAATPSSTSTARRGPSRRTRRSASELGDRPVPDRTETASSSDAPARFWGQHIRDTAPRCRRAHQRVQLPRVGDDGEDAACALLAGVPVIEKPGSRHVALIAWRMRPGRRSNRGLVPEGAFQFICGSAGDLLEPPRTARTASRSPGSAATGRHHPWATRDPRRPQRAREHRGRLHQRRRPRARRRRGRPRPTACSSGTSGSRHVPEGGTEVHGRAPRCSSRSRPRRGGQGGPRRTSSRATRSASPRRRTTRLGPVAHSGPARRTSKRGDPRACPRSPRRSSHGGADARRSDGVLRVARRSSSRATRMPTSSCSTSSRSSALSRRSSRTTGSGGRRRWRIREPRRRRPRRQSAYSNDAEVVRGVRPGRQRPTTAASGWGRTGWPSRPCRPAWSCRQLVHGGPGRAGGGEELGALRGPGVLHPAHGGPGLQELRRRHVRRVRFLIHALESAELAPEHHSIATRSRQATGSASLRRNALHSALRAIDTEFGRGTVSLTSASSTSNRGSLRRTCVTRITSS